MPRTARAPRGIEIVIHSDGTQEVTVVSILEDLEEDCRYYLRLAANLGEPSPDLLEYKRASRSALLSFYAYAEAVLNLTLFALRVPPPQKANFFIKLDLVEKTISTSRNRRQANPTAVTRLRSLRNAFEHLQPGNDFKLFKQLDHREIEKLCLLFKRWIRALPKPVQLVLRPFSRGLHNQLRRELLKYGIETTVLTESTHVS